MGVITKLAPFKDKQGFYVFLDGKMAFKIDLATYIKEKVEVGQNLTEEDKDRLQEKGDTGVTYERVSRFVSIRPRSRGEVKEWFKRKNVKEATAARVMTKLEKLGFVDDKAFAEWWVEQRLAFRPKPKKVLFHELYRKGIDKKIITRVLEKTDIDEVGNAVKEIQKKGYRWQRLPKLIQRKKMTDFLLRKGYSWDIVSEVTKGLEKDIDN